MKNDYQAGQRAFNAWLIGHGLRKRHTIDHGLQRAEHGWEHFAWTVTVDNRYGEHSTAAFDYRQGTAHTKPPSLVDVMANLLRDAECTRDSFEDFCSDLGYDSDSRHAEKIFEQIRINNGKLLRLFRSTDMDALLDEARPLLEAAGL